MFIINKSQTSLSDDKMSLVTEASSVGFQVGEWPDIVSVVDDNNTGFLFFKHQQIDHHGEFGGYKYLTKNQQYGLTVFND